MAHTKQPENVRFVETDSSKPEHVHKWVLAKYEGRIDLGNNIAHFVCSNQPCKQRKIVEYKD